MGNSSLSVGNVPILAGGKAGGLNAATIWCISFFFYFFFLFGSVVVVDVIEIKSSIWESVGEL